MSMRRGQSDTILKKIAIGCKSGNNAVLGPIRSKMTILDYHKYLKPAKPNKKMKIGGWEK